MSSPRNKALLVLAVLTLSLTLPAFSGGNDAPIVPPAGKSSGERFSAGVEGGNDGPAIPPGGPKPHALNQKLSVTPFAKLPIRLMVLRILLAWR
jgi:hypothetical protein